jgi:hypothetical protein
LTIDDKLINIDTDKVVPYEEIHSKLLKPGLSDSDKEMLEKTDIYSKENSIVDLLCFGKEIKVKFGWDEIDDKLSFVEGIECLLI